MSTIAGILDIKDSDRAFVSTIGQAVVYDAIVKALADHNEELNRMKAAWVEGQTEDHKRRFRLPGDFTLTRVGSMAAPPATKLYGYYDVAFPIEEYAGQIAGDRVSLAYMSIKELDKHLTGILDYDVRMQRKYILFSLLDSQAGSYWTFTDPVYGDLQIMPLANGDSVVYPPVVGSDTEAADDHYLASGYTAANISDTNNPFVTLEAELTEHFSKSQGNDAVAVWINTAQVAKCKALSGFVAYQDAWVAPGQDTAVPARVPASFGPGRIIGRVSGCWVIEWAWMPANYMFACVLDEEKPLLERVDAADSGLGTGLQLVAQTSYAPLSGSHYSHRFGFGVANRLNGAVMFLDAGASYTIPSSYTERP